MTYEIFQSPGTELCEREALIIEQREGASYRAKSLYILMGSSVGVVALLNLNILIMETTLASWTEWGVEGEGREAVLRRGSV